MSDAALVLAVGGAVLAPSLLAPGGAISKPIDPWVSTAQMAAASALSAPILGIGPLPAPGASPKLALYSASYRYTSVRAALIPSRGAIGAAKNFARLTADESASLLARFIAATLAGVKAGYLVTETERMGVNIGLGTTGEAIAGELARGFPFADIELTPLGEALLAAGTEHARLVALYGSVHDPIKAQTLCGALAREMDDQGYRITGAPEVKTLMGGLDAAWTATKEWASDLPARGAWFLGEGAASILLSTPGLLLAAGLIVYKVTR